MTKIVNEIKEKEEELAIVETEDIYTDSEEDNLKE